MTDSPARAAPVEADTSAPVAGVAAVVAGLGIILVAANLRPAVVSVAPLVEEIKAATGWNSSITGLLTTLPVLVFGIVAPVAPRCAARFGIERTVFGALAVLAAGIVLRLVPESWALFTGSALIGAGIGICNVLLPSLIKRDFANRSGLMTGLYSLTLSGGAAVASGLSVPLNDATGGNWRLAMASWAVPVVIAMVVWLPQLRQVHREHPPRGHEALWRNGMAWAITIFMASQSFIFFTFIAWLPELLIDRGIRPAAAGAILAVGQIGGLAASLIAPIIATRYRDQRALTGLTLIVCAVGFVGLLTTDKWPVLWALCVMIGPGAGIALALLFMVLRSTSTTQTGQVSGMSQSLGYFMAALGPVAIGALHDLTGSWTVAMAALALVLIPQTLASLVAGRDATMTPRP